MKNQTLEIKPSQKVFTDKKTNAKTIALPFKLPDGTQAICMISRLNDGDWKPRKDISSLTINFNEN